MSKILEVFLGILTAMGGFVEVGELVFTLSGGAKFGYSLLWVILLGTVGIITYGEMSGRVVAVTKEPVFYVIRNRMGFATGLATLVAANIVSLMTCAAEVGGVAIVLRLLSGYPYALTVLVAFAILVISVWVLSLQWIERVFGLLGLLMIIFLMTALSLGPDWQQAARGLVPNLPAVESAQQYWSYAYYVVAVLSSIILPYETYFYASGAMEDGWQPEDIPLNRVIVVVGFGLGAALAASLLVIGAETYLPDKIDPELPGAAALAAGAEYGRIGVLMALLGMFFAFAGAGIENALSGAYNLAQFLGWPWGKARKPVHAPRFTVTWIVMFAAATLIIATGVDPVSIVEYSIVFAVLVLPLTYLPLLLAASDREIMGEHANGPVAKAFGWFFLIVVSLAGLSVIPLYIASKGGSL
jgi:manganese transport protein